MINFEPIEWYLGSRIVNFLLKSAFSLLHGGERGIRTPEPFGSMVFKTTAIDHSAISPSTKKLTARDNKETCKQLFKNFYSRFFL